MRGKYCERKGAARKKKGVAKRTGLRIVGLTRRRSRTTLSLSRNRRRSALRVDVRDGGEEEDRHDGKERRGWRGSSSYLLTNCRNFDYRHPYVPTCAPEYIHTYTPSLGCFVVRTFVHVRIRVCHRCGYIRVHVRLRLWYELNV